LPIFNNIAGAWRQVAKSYSNINGVYREDKKVYDNVAGAWKEAYSAGILAIFNQYESIETAVVRSLPLILENTYYVDAAGLHVHYKVECQDPNDYTGEILWRLIFAIPLSYNVSFSLLNKNVHLVKPAILTLAAGNTNTKRSMMGAFYNVLLGARLVGSVGGGFKYGYWVEDQIASPQTITIPGYQRSELPSNLYLDDNYFGVPGKTTIYTTNTLYMCTSFSFPAQRQSPGCLLYDFNIPNEAIEVLIDNNYVPISFI
jgi:hypothetical protein